LTRPLTSGSIKEKSREFGFDLCGVARAERHPRLARLADWVAAGTAGDMEYLRQSLGERLDPARVLVSARSVVSLGCVYNTDTTYSYAVADPERAFIARYAWGDDYHEVLRGRLRRLVGWMADEAGRGFEAFSCVDSGPVQERVFAEQAGLGWIGKNTCLINPELGSWLFLGEIITNWELEIDPPAVDHCGSCTRCLEACPTSALTPYTLDATRCLSYLTIEARGRVTSELRPAITQQVLGCDICQDVCPWNRRPAISGDPAWRPRSPLASARVVDLCALSDDQWRQLLKGSAMRRAGLRRIRRSLAYAAASLPSSTADVALEALASHRSGQDADVADAIAWAKNRVHQVPGVPKVH
jgi:epoxyqueuosine reductase